MSAEISNTYKCHLVSRILLRQFLKDKHIKFFDRSDDKWSTTNSLEDIAFINLPKNIFQPIESEWGRIETQVGIIFQRFGNNPIKYLEDQQSVNVMKKFMAMHFVRSTTYFKLLPKYAMEREKELINSLSFINQDLVKTEWRTRVISSTPNMIKDVFLKIIKDMTKYHIELGIAPKNRKFILGDMPVINFNKDNNGQKNYGIIGGVGYKSSEAFMLPISPDYLLSLTVSKPNIFNLKGKDVMNTNKMTRKIYFNRFFCAPN